MNFYLLNNLDIIKTLIKTKPKAIARVYGSSLYNKVWGKLKFYNSELGVIVLSEIHNLPQTETNIFALHIHSGNQCEGNFDSAMGHYNPDNKLHPNHKGDLPPLFSNNGYAWSAVLTSRFTIEEIIGKTVIIHDKPDDFTSQPAGNSGVRIACGIIKVDE